MEDQHNNPPYQDQPGTPAPAPTQPWQQQPPVAPEQPQAFTPLAPEQLQPTPAYPEPQQPLTAQPAYVQYAPQQPEGGVVQPQGQSAEVAAIENPEKSYLVALLLSYFLGSMGVDRFYLGKVKTGVLKLITFGGLGIWQLVDVLLVGFGKLRAKNDNRPLEGFAKNYKWVKLVTIVLIIFNVVIFMGIFLVVILGGLATKRQANETYQQNQRLQSQQSTQFPSSSSSYTTN